MGEMKRQPEREREQKTGVIITSALPAHRPKKQAERPAMPDHAQPAGRPGAGKARPAFYYFAGNRRSASPVSVSACAARPNPPDAVLNTIKFRLTPSGAVRCLPILPTSPYPTPAHSSIQAEIGTPAARVDWAFAGRPDKTTGARRLGAHRLGAHRVILPNDDAQMQAAANHFDL